MRRMSCAKLTHEETHIFCCLVPGDVSRHPVLSPSTHGCPTSVMERGTRKARPSSLGRCACALLIQEATLQWLGRGALPRALFGTESCHTSTLFLTTRAVLVHIARQTRGLIHGSALCLFTRTELRLALTHLDPRPPLSHFVLHSTRHLWRRASTMQVLRLLSGDGFFHWPSHARERRPRTGKAQGLRLVRNGHADGAARAPVVSL